MWLASCTGVIPLVHTHKLSGISCKGKKCGGRRKSHVVTVCSFYRSAHRHRRSHNTVFGSLPPKISVPPDRLHIKRTSVWRWCLFGHLAAAGAETAGADDDHGDTAQDRRQHDYQQVQVVVLFLVLFRNRI